VIFVFTTLGKSDDPDVVLSDLEVADGLGHLLELGGHEEVVRTASDEAVHVHVVRVFRQFVSSGAAHRLKLKFAHFSKI